MLAVILAALMVFSFLFGFSFKNASADAVTKTIKLKIGSNTVYINGQPKVLDATAGTYIVQNQYIFISIQCGGRFYGPNFPDKFVGWESYFYFAPVANLLFKKPENAGLGINALLENYYKVLKRFPWHYYKASRTSKVLFKNETPNSGLTDVTMRYANGNIYAFYRYTSGVIPNTLLLFTSKQHCSL